jgi:hypothetical protein
VGVLQVYGELDPYTLVSPITDATGRLESSEALGRGDP